MPANRSWVCLIICLFYFFIFLFIIGFVIFWLIFLPQEPKFSIQNASLTLFNLTTSPADDNNNNNHLNKNTLHYNLTLDINIRNPNKRVGINYRRVLLVANYRKKRFSLVRLSSTPFYQGHKNTTILHADVRGQQQLTRFGEGDVSKFNSETATGVYTIDVKIALRIGLRYGNLKTGYFKVQRKSVCKLKVPLIMYNGTISSPFQTTKCKSIYIFGDPNARSTG